MNNNDKQFIVDSVNSLTKNYDKLTELLSNNDEALQYFEEAIANLEHCIDSIYNK